jgi:hypothetical protein
MAKLKDLESEERNAIEDELEAKSKSLGLDAWDSFQGNTDESFLKDHVGMCYNCKSLLYCRAEYAGHDRVFAQCSMFQIRLSGKHRMTECNCHSPKKLLSLEEMYAMATLIESDDRGKVKGFISTDPKLRSKKS